MARPLEWTHQAIDVGKTGFSTTRTGTADELTDLARSLDIPAFEQLSVSYKISPKGRDRFTLEGTLSASLMQACVITLEPLATDIEEPFAIELRPAEAAETVIEQDEEFEILALPDIEPMTDGVIDVGALMYELISASLNPYPKRDGAELDWVDPASKDPALTGPFAALAKLKANDDKPQT